jgi:NACalpha-BTF3-like transcription factor
MATDIATLAIKVENGDVVKATTSVNNLAVAGDKTEKATQRLTRRMALLQIEAHQMDRAMSKGALSLTSLATKMGVSEAAAARLTAAFGALGAVAAAGFIGRKIITESVEAQKAAAQLEAVIRSTGGAAGYTSTQLETMADQLSKVSTYEDDAIVGAQALLATFTNVRGDVFRDATQAILDMSTALGQDLNTSALQLGKALNDPIAGIGALRRAGVQLSASQTDLVKSLVASGRAADAQRIILKELETQMGGSAAAARDTLGGALQGLSNAWGNLFEVSQTSSSGMVVAINAIADALPAVRNAINDFVTNTITGANNIGAAFQKAWTYLTTINAADRRKALQEIEEMRRAANALARTPSGGPTTAGTIAAPRPIDITVNTKKAKEAIDELQRATDKYYSDLEKNKAAAFETAASARAETAAIEAMTEAYRQGPAAVEAMRVAQAGENAVKELGIGVTDRMTEAVRRNAEARERAVITQEKVKDAQADAAREAERQADEAQRQMERRAHDIHRATVSTIEGIFTDIANRKNPLIALAEGFKRAMIRSISEALATKLEAKFGDLLGIERPATKQEKAARDMNTAADKMLRAAGQMSAGPGALDQASKLADALGKIDRGEWEITGPSGKGGIADASTVFNDVSRQRYMQQMLGVAGAGLAGFGLGQGIGQATRSGVAGAIGGAASGAATGFALGGPVGAAVGGIAGFVGGIIGAGDAARAAAERMRKAKEAFDSAFDTAKAQVAGDDLALQIAQTEAQFDQLRDALKESSTWLQRVIGTELGMGEYANTLDEVNALQAERVRQLQEEAAIQQKRGIEDYAARLAAATPGNEREEAIEAFNRGKDRELEDLKRRLEAGGWEAWETATYEMAQQAIAAEKAKNATEALSHDAGALAHGHHGPRDDPERRDQYQGRRWKDDRARVPG